MDAQLELRKREAPRRVDRAVTKVLVIDNDSASLRLVQEAQLHNTATSLAVQWAGTLAAGLEHLDEDGFDIVLLDLALPDSQGLEGVIKVHARCPNTPLIVLSNWADELVAIKALEEGAQDYLITHRADGQLLLRAIRYATERTRSELALEQERELFNALMDNIPDHIYFKDCESRFIHINRAVAQQFGLTVPEQAIGQTDFDFFTPEHARPAFDDEQEIIRTGQPIIGKVEKETMPDGSVTWALTSKLPLRDKEGRIIGTFGISKDVTALKDAEDRLRRKATALQAAANAVVITDLSGRVIWVNAAFCKLTGYSVKEIIGQSTRILKSGKHTAAFYADLWHTITGGRVWNGEIINRRKNGTFYTEQMTITPIHDETGTIKEFVAIKMDITDKKRAEERVDQLNADLAKSQLELLAVYEDLKRSNEELKKTQAQLIQAAKMESVGRLAAGIAHEVKNPLEIILMGIGYLTDNLRSDDRNIKTTLRDMRDGVERSDAIIQELLDFSVPSRLKLRNESLNSIINRALLLVRHELARSHIRVIKHLAKSTPAVHVDRIKVQQVFVNLFMNAIHAMPQGGQLTVTVSSQTLPDGATAIVAVVEDAGTGIPEDQLMKIFDPFFTTKPAGKGSGLGLAVAKGIIESHGGSISIVNRSEGGVRATVTFKA